MLLTHCFSHDLQYKKKDHCLLKALTFFVKDLQQSVPKPCPCIGAFFLMCTPIQHRQSYLHPSSVLAQEKAVA